MKKHDDGIQTRYTMSYKDWVRATMDAGISGSPDPLDEAQAAAERLLEHVAANPDTLGDGDADHAQRLHTELGNLRAALDGGDLRRAARAGVAFGKALEQMRVRLVATTRIKHRRGRAGGKNGADKATATRATATEKGYAEYRRIYAELKQTRPRQNDDQLFEYIEDKHGERVKGRFGCGSKKGTIRTAVTGKK